MKTKKENNGRMIRWFRKFSREFVIIFAFYFLCSSAAFANPNGAQIIHGNVNINAQGNTLNITNSPNSIINWQGFSINQNEITRFIQQNATSAVLNRVIGQDPSAILGALQSNGRVFLINPNGLLIGQGARIEVNGFFASTLNLSNQDFLSGKYNFTAGLNPGAIKNQGTITTPTGGQVYLIAPNVENTGIITAPGGDIVLMAGRSVQLVDSNDPFISVVVSAPSDKAVNLGQIVAQSGKVGIYGGLIKQGGTVSADGAVVGEGGKIFFKATKDVTLDAGSTTSANGAGGGRIKIQSESGTTLVSGKVTAVGHEGKGGEIQILGNQVGLIDNAQIDASGKTGGGTILIGGDYQGKNSDVQNAKAAYVGKDTVIKADALETGDGGKVIVWADDVARFYGNIFARGGLLSGNGGFAEVSGKKYLDYSGMAYLAANRGLTGTLLLDPSDITITGAGTDIDPVTGSFAGDGPFNFTGTADSSTLYIGTGAGDTKATLLRQLNDANVTISTSPGSAGNGDITVADNIYYTGASERTLTLQADRNINISDYKSVSTSTAPLNLAMTGAALAMGNGSSITTGNGYVNITADDMTLSGTMNSGSGRVTLQALTANRPIDLGTKTQDTLGLTVAELANITTTGVLQIGNYTNGGAISLTAPITGLSVPTLDLESASTITETASGALVVPNLALRAKDVIDINQVGVNDVSVLAATQENGTYFAYQDINDLTVGVVDGLPGVTTDSAQLNLFLPAGNLTLNADVTNTYNTYTGNGMIQIMLYNPGYTLINYANITAPNLWSDITIAADDMQLNPGSTIQGASYVTLSPGGWSSSRSIDLGTDTPGLLGLTNTELNTISTPLLKIYGSQSGSTNISSDITMPPGTNRLDLYSYNGISGTGLITVPTLGLSASSNGGSGIIDVTTAVNSIAALNINNPITIRNTAPSSTLNIITLTNVGIGDAIGLNSGTADIHLTENSTGEGKGNVTATSSITASGLELAGAGTFSFAAENSVSTLAANVTGGLNFNNPSGFTIGNVGNITGITTAGSVTLNSTGTINPIAPVTAGSFTLGSGTWYQVAGSLPAFSATDFNVSGGTFIRALGGDGNSATPFQLTDIYGVQGMGGADALGKSFVLVNSIDAAGTSGWNPNGSGGYYGFVPIGNYDTNFTGAFNGQSNTITGLYINRPATDYVGLFGYINGATIQNVGVVDSDVTGQNYVGGLVGFNKYGDIQDSYSEAAVTGTDYVGGLVGFNTGAISNSYSAGTVSGTNDVGGLVGHNEAYADAEAYSDVYATISNSYSTGNVTGAGDNVGGLVGYNYAYVDDNAHAGAYATISNSYNAGTVNGTGNHVGGLVGQNYAYSTGGYGGSDYVGAADISNSYSTGAVNGASNVGGLVGDNNNVGAYGYATINTAYSTGLVTGSSNVGGLVGENSGTVDYSFWDTQTSEKDTSAGGTGMTTEQMMTGGNFSGWDFQSTWWMSDGNTRPFLQSEYSTTITNAHQLQLMAMNLNTDYALSKNIDLTADLANPSGMWGTAGFVPIGNAETSSPFTGTFDGLGHTITGLTINRPSAYNVGLFGVVSGSMPTIQNVGLVDVNITGYHSVGGLVGYNGGGIITNSYTTGVVTETGNEPFSELGLYSVGGLVGDNVNGIISNSYSTATVTGIIDVGGLVGYNSGAISNSYSTGAVNGTTNVGGLVGYNLLGDISNSYSTGVVSGTNGDSDSVGGLVGKNEGSISNSYSTGAVSGTTNVGGLIGINTSGLITSSFWDTQTSGLATSAAGTGKTTSEMKTLATYSGASWDIDDAGGTDKVWRIYDGYTYPLLRSFLTTATATVSNPTTKEYNASTTVDGASHAWDIAVDGGKISGTPAYTLASKNVGSQAVSLNGLYSLQDGYDITTVNGTIDITRAALTVTATGQNKVYDTTTDATVTLGDNRLGSDALTLAYGSASFSNKNVGTAKPVGVSAIDVTGTDAGNYSFNTTASTSADITKAALTVTATGQNKVYDTTTDATVTLGDNRLGSDALTLAYGSASFSNKNVGTAKPVGVSAIDVTGTDAGNYSFNTTASTSADITKAALTVTATGQNKVYDTTTDATVTLGDNRLGSDALTLAYGSASFSNKNVGTAKPVGVSAIDVTGTDAGNYSFNTTASTSADITKAALTVTATGQNKVYDTTTDATVTLGDNRLGSDALTLAYGSASFSNKNVGTAKPVGVSAIDVTGTDAGNYSFNTTASTSADITKAALTVTATGQNKVYDTTTDATVTLGDNRLGSDALTLAYGSASFNDKNVGTAKPVGVSAIDVTGTDAGNYSFNTTASTSADITKAALTVTATGQNKVYDTTTDATVTLGDNRLGSDALTLAYGSASFSNKNVGTAKPVGVSAIDVTGTDAGNYSFNTTASTSADITKAALTVTATGQNKVYDTTTDATVTLGDNRLGSDALTLAYGSASFSNKNVGTAKPVGVSAIDVTGTDAGNYSFNTTASTSADITKAALTVTATGQNKVYDTTTDATVTLGDNRLGSDALTLAYGSASFSNKNVGTAKPVGVSAIDVTGTDAGNYSFNTTASTSADITKAALTVTATGQNKVYDTTTDATVTLGDNRLGSDALTLAYGSASFSNKNVGTAKPVGVSAIDVTGTDAGNYSFNTTASTSADITKAALTVTATGQNKVYDTTTDATVTLGDNRLGSDALTLAYGSASFSNKNVGTAKPVGVSAIDVTGTDAGNYSFNTTASTSADITKAALTTSGALAQNKTYDATTAATITGETLVGVFQNDLVTVSGGGTFADKNYGTGKAVTSALTLGSTDAGNYNLIQPTGLTADISKATLTLTATTKTKIYDGTTNASAVPVPSGLKQGDSIADLAELYDSRHVGTGKVLSVAAGYTLNDGNSGQNYNVITVSDYTGVITRLNSVEWVGSGTGNWSDAANWQGGAIPDGSNVANVNIPSGSGTVNYDISSMTTNLDAITSGRNVNLTAGNLAIKNSASFSGTLNVAGAAANFGSSNASIDKLNLSAGSLTGTGNLAVMTDYNKTGGTLGTTFQNLTLSKAGNFATEALTASNSITLSATGNITQSGALTTPTLHVTNTSGSTDLGTQTNNIAHLGTINAAGQSFSIHNAGALDQTGVVTANTFAATLDAGALTLGNQANAIAYLGAISAPGGFTLHETGALATGSLPVQSSGGSISITAHSPLTIGSGGVSAKGDITLEAAASGSGDNLTISGNVVSSSGNATLKAGNAITGMELVSAPGGTVSGTINLNSGSGSGLSTTTTSTVIEQTSNNCVVAQNSVMVTTTESKSNTLESPSNKDDKDKDKDKDKDNSSTKKEGQDSGTQKPSLPYCN